MKEIADEFKKSTKPGAAKTVGKFLVTTTAVAVIFFFITYALKKLLPDDSGGGGGGGRSVDDESNKRKAAVIKALTEHSKDIRNLSRLLTVWFDAHSSEKVKIAGMDLPLVDIFTDYTTPMGTVSY